jgi:hypothetical protein
LVGHVTGIAEAIKSFRILTEKPLEKQQKLEPNLKDGRWVELTLDEFNFGPR